jgi:hypothetical protein
MMEGMPPDYTFQALSDPRESHLLLRCTKCKRTFHAMPHHQPGNPSTFFSGDDGVWITCVTHNCTSRYVGLAELRTDFEKRK